MNILDHISEGLKTIFWVKILKILVADPDPGSGNRDDPWIWDGKNSDPGSGIIIPDPQHCRLGRRKHAVPWTDWGNRKRRGGKVVEALQ